ncbi:unnamed protein product [Leptidea sinapis]|uniref:Transcriptional adapter n=1 Tax=Leptidea sinapis TaxID=189913 RepID=A0A5E4QCX9_9NEOP|nr:unnamed protein product [Leptidea sinapis]
MSIEIFQVKCDTCSEIVHEPFIECCECDCNLCCACFSSGRQIGNHKNSHNYAIRRNDFPLFDNCNWSAKEESRLLSALSIYGFGNWEEIAKYVHTRSKLECQEHYKKYYIENVQYEALKLLPETKQSLFPKPATPYLFNLDISINPPRNNQADPHLAGYNAFRSEFEFNYDHNAEGIFNIEDSHSEDEDDDCMDALKVSLVSALNTRLKERQRRYEIIQNHGLIMPNKLLSWLKSYEGTATGRKVERFISFMQFMTGMQFDSFIVSQYLEDDLLQTISKLCNYRANGIKSLYAAHLYCQLKKYKENAHKEQKHFTHSMSKNFESQSPTKNKFSMKKHLQYIRFRSSSLPLDIEDLPKYHLLLDNEKILCSNIRLTPESYLEIKHALIQENTKLGGLRLLDARRIVKKDVNKTRKIYDFLLTEGFVNKNAII